MRSGGTAERFPRHGRPVPPAPAPQFPSPLNCLKNCFGGLRLLKSALNCFKNCFGGLRLLKSAQSAVNCIKNCLGGLCSSPKNGFNNCFGGLGLLKSVVKLPWRSRIAEKRCKNYFCGLGFPNTLQKMCWWLGGLKMFQSGRSVSRCLKMFTSVEKCFKDVSSCLRVFWKL